MTTELSRVRLSSASAFDVASARFWRHEARIELLRPEDLDPLTAAVYRFVEGANLDARLSGCP